MVIQHTVLLGLYGKLFHSYQFSSLVRFKTTSLNWISLVMKIDIRGIISHITLVGMLYYYIMKIGNISLVKFAPWYLYLHGNLFYATDVNISQCLGFWIYSNTILCISKTYHMFTVHISNLYFKYKKYIEQDKKFD